MTKTILYKCSDCQNEKNISESDHTSAYTYVQCGCGEKMMPVNKEDLETMDIYDEYD